MGKDVGGQRGRDGYLAERVLADGNCSDISGLEPLPRPKTLDVNLNIDDDSPWKYVPAARRTPPAGVPQNPYDVGHTQGHHRTVHVRCYTFDE